MRELPTRSAAEVERHEHWYTEYCTLLERKKRAIDDWKTAKQVGQSPCMQTVYSVCMIIGPPFLRPPLCRLPLAAILIAPSICCFGGGEVDMCLADPFTFTTALEGAMKLKFAPFCFPLDVLLPGILFGQSPIFQFLAENHGL